MGRFASGDARSSRRPVWSDQGSASFGGPTTLNGTPLLREYLNAEVRDYLIVDPADCGIT
jgi:hypothetical protein